MKRRRQLSTILMLLSSLVLAACETTDNPDNAGIVPPLGPGPNPKPVDTEIRIKPGDKIELLVKEDESLNGSYAVGTRGDVIIPQTLESVKVAGLTDYEAAAAVKKALEGGLLTKATVVVRIPFDPNRNKKPDNPQNSNAVVVMLDGRVRAPGTHTIPGRGNDPPMAYQAVLHTGGFADFANLKKSVIRRMAMDGRYMTIPINFEAIEDGKTPDVPLVNNDIIYVKPVTIGSRW